jgi:phage tail sheath gpL-like
MNIFFDNIPNSIRKPGQYIEFNSRLAVNSLPANAQKLLLIGQKTGSGAVSQLVPTQLYSDQDASDAFGSGSILHLMANAALKCRPGIQLFAVAIDDAGAGVARVCTVTIAGTIAASGWVRLWIGDVYAEVAYVSTDTAITIATALKTALDTLTGLPFTYTRTDGVLTFTAKNKGTVANQIAFTCEVSAAGGATETYAQTTAGATDPDIHATSGLLDTIAPERYHVIASSFNDSTSLGYIKTHLATVSGPVEQRPGVCVAGLIDNTLANAHTLADAIEHERMLIAYFRACKTSAFKIGAAVGAVLAYVEDPAKSLDEEILTGVVAPAASGKTTKNEQETLLLQGVTPLDVGAGETVEIVRAISTYQASATWLDITTVRTLDYVRDAVRTRIKLRFTASKLNARVRADIKSEILSVLKQLEDAEIIENVDANKDGVLVEQNAVDPNRADAKIPADVVNAMHVFAGRLDLIL